MVMTAEEFIKNKEEEFKKNPFHFQEDKERKGTHKFKRVAYRIYVEGTRKVIIVSRLIRVGYIGEIEYKETSKQEMDFVRAEYWIVTAKKKTGKEFWAYGQFPANVPIGIYEELMKETL